jgi:NAD(P)-dependent dehydrogenase (short-subunit alcohol dehydrogenase family)
MNGVSRGKPNLTTVSAATLRADGLRVAIVGGTGGLGRAIAQLLASKGAKVTVVGRTFRDAGTPNLDFLAADLESVAESKRLAAALPAEDLDVLIFTTGIITAPVREVSAEGIERDMAISYVSRFVILRAVADRLGKNRPNRPRVFVMGFPGTDEKGNPDDLNAEKKYEQFPAHLNTVAANEALVLDAASRYPRLAVFGINPGLVKTDIRANVLGGTDSFKFKFVETLIGLFTPTPDTFAQRIVPKLLAPELESESGFHFNKNGVPIAPSKPMTPEHVAAFMTGTERLLTSLRL